ncbi:MAG: DUF2723 domain-containing protein, partial [Candidatus Kapaibacterium sp.]
LVEVAVSLLLYTTTMIPHVGFTDSGELAGACASLGVAHPTGYPLFVLIGHLWTLLPLPLSVIVKMNLFAAACTAFSASMMFLLLHLMLEWWDVTGLTRPSLRPSVAKRQRKRSPDEQVPATTEDAGPPSDSIRCLVAAAGALLYAFARTVWDQAVGIEVYSLHLALITSTLFLACKGILRSSDRTLYAAALLLGLSFTNHLTTILLVIPLTVLFFFPPRGTADLPSERMRRFLQLLGIVAACSLIYGSLPLISRGDPLFNWGSVHRGWEQFSYHVFGKQYSVWMFSDEPGATRKQFAVFASLLPHNLAYIGIALSVAGFILLLRTPSRRAMGVFLLSSCICGVGYSVNYSIPDIDSYFLSTFIALICSATLAVYAMLRSAPAAAYAFMLLPIVSVVDNKQVCDQSGNTLVRDYVHCMIDPLPTGSVVVSQQWDYLCSAFWYMQQVEGFRTDVVLIEKELLRRTWYPLQLSRWYPSFMATVKAPLDSYLTDLRDFERDSKEFMSDPRRSASIQTKFIALLNSFVSNALLERHPVFATQEVLQSEAGFAADYTLSAFGLAVRIHTDPAPSLCDATRLPLQPFLSSAQRVNRTRLEKDIVSLASMELLNNVNVALALGDTPAAQWYARQATAVDPTNQRARLAVERLSE